MYVIFQALKFWPYLESVMSELQTIENPITYYQLCFKVTFFVFSFFFLQKTPMEVAAERGHMDIVHYLRGDDNGDSISNVNIIL